MNSTHAGLAHSVVVLVAATTPTAGFGTVLADWNLDALSGKALGECRALLDTRKLLRTPDREWLGKDGCQDGAVTGVETAASATPDINKGHFEAVTRKVSAILLSSETK